MKTHEEMTEARKARYDGRTFITQAGTRFRVWRGATGHVMRTSYANGAQGLTDLDELEEEMLAGDIRPVELPQTHEAEVALQPEMS